MSKNSNANFNLEHLFETLHGAVTSAVQSTENSVWESTANRYFEPDPAGGYRPKMITLNMPSVVDGKIEYSSYEIPMFSLVKPTCIALDEMSMEFDVELQGQEKNAITAALPRNITNKDGSSSADVNSRAKLMMKFKATDPQEGVMLINDKLIKVIPR